jgi:hypothetical protein
MATTAKGVVVKASSQMVRVRMPARSIDGRYDVELVGILMLPGGDPVPGFTRNGHITSEVVTIEADAEVPPPSKLVLTTHTVCRDPDGKIKWEADTKPLELPVTTYEVLGVTPRFQMTTAQIKTGKEHF